MSDAKRGAHTKEDTFSISHVRPGGGDRSWEEGWQPELGVFQPQRGSRQHHEQQQQCYTEKSVRDADARANEGTNEREREPPRIRNSDIGACNRSVRTRRSVHGPCE
jgi:hypothetical protein